MRTQPLFAPLFAVAFAGCYTAMLPPTTDRVGHYCQQSAQEADARALRQRAIGGAAIASSAIAFGAAPIVASGISDERSAASAGVALSAAAFLSAWAAMRALSSAEHESAIASAFGSCMANDGDYETAREVYKLWLQPDVSRAELIRAATDRSQSRREPPPPPWADEPTSRPPGDPEDKILRTQLFRIGKKL